MKTHKFIDTPIGRLLLVVERGALTAVFHDLHKPPPIPSAVGLPFARILGANTIPGLSNGSGAPGTSGGSAGSGGHTSAAGGSGVVEEHMSAASLKADTATFNRASDQFRAYFAGSRRAFSLPVHANGTDFQQKVWAAVLAIPYGETRSYRELAAQLGNPLMGRAIGAAIRVNPLSIIIPGHRVVRSTGGITGYSAGPEVKRFLLELEAGDAIRPAA
ncbi:methylated-DNA--[protein]-cysteine S-methyltransferase [Arthrobacter sp. TB 23]|uniref:methylated-DNA--[protein]-cysteine S-methyltransferase n=1 Tax=Arthrobacter sp. TB 23 TaxID=494419 RepID=UPI00035C3504|nr:methylated-DNA--[protein]-cysteine S-methyltransferase [Arthrobacter sp. TB 23]